MMLYLVAGALAFQPATEVVPLDQEARGFWVHDGSMYIHFGDDDTLNSYDVTTWEPYVLYGEGTYSPTYAGDLGRFGDGPFCGDGLDTVHCLTRALVLENDWVVTPTDIDGDGAVDLVGAYRYHMDRGDSLESFEYPTIATTPSRPYPVGDIDGDGATDLVLLTFTEPQWWGFFYSYLSSSLSLHRGTPAGYASEPTWVIDVGGPVEDLVDIQADTDPERELVLAVGDEVDEADYGPSTLQLATLDPTGPEPTLWRSEQVYYPWGFLPSDQVATLHPIGDVDGDGAEEVLLVSGVPPEHTSTEDTLDIFRVLTSANGWDLYEPLVALIPSEGPDCSFENVRVITADVNEDGRLDIVSARANHNRCGAGVAEPPEVPGTLQVWYAPWLEADPVLPHTGDTGATGHTGIPSTSDTGDTGTDATADPQGHDTPDEGGCGCQASPTTTLWSFIARRRAAAP